MEINSFSLSQTKMMHVSAFLSFSLVILSHVWLAVDSLGVDIGGGTIGIGIGIGGSPSSDGPPGDGPLVFESPRIEMAYYVIQELKAKICWDPHNDPHNVTATWVGPDVCNKYKGFGCAVVPTYKEKAVSDVQFNGFSLKAPIAGFIDRLLDVSIFHANSNRFHGVVPSNIGPNNLPFLFELDLSNNAFSGSFPATVLRATRLTFLDLRFNAFTGTVPPEALSLPVDVLFINNNAFMQPVPTNLGRSPALYLTFANNRMTGSIPSSIGLANATLKEVLFLGNSLSGCLPWEIGLLRRATIFDASKNRLTGPIPGSFGCLNSIRILNFANNLLYGPVPEVVCGLPRLISLVLHDNYFTALGPRCWELLKARKLDIGRNCIPGLPNQRSPIECWRFFSYPKLTRCPDPYLHVPCKPRDDVTYPKRRRAAEVGRVRSLTYAALNRR